MFSNSVCFENYNNTRYFMVSVLIFQPRYQDQDFSQTGPTIWLWNMEDHKERWKKTEQFPIQMPKTDSED